MNVLVRNELSWWRLAERKELRPSAVGGKRITPRRAPRRKHLVAHK